MLRLEEVCVPDLGDFKDVRVIEVLVGEGQDVNTEDPLITLKSDKATMDVPSPQAGKVNDLTVSVGDKVSPGDLILVLEVEVMEREAAPAPVPASFNANGQQQLELPTGEPVNKAEPAPAEAPAPAPVPAAEQPVSETGGVHAVNVPDIGDFHDVEVIEVLVGVGDTVQAEDPLITLESDKATMDVPSPAGGTVVAMQLQKGDKVSEGAPILQLAAKAGAGPATESVAKAPATTAAAASSETLSGAAPRARPAPPPSLPTPLAQPNGAIPHASPGVRRFARELGVDLHRVAGSGPKTRILKQDVQDYVKTQLAQPAAAAAAAGRAEGLALPELPPVDFAQFGDIEIRPLGRIKKLTATHLHRAWLLVPHVTQHDEADITELEEFRKQAKEEAAQSGVRLTMLAFLMKACVSALKQFPTFNASLESGGENLIIKQYYNLGVAVDTPDGLVVPVIHDVAHKGVLDLARELGEISERTRDKQLRPQDLQGGTFTISSLGGIGGTAFTPIVNAPEVAILGVSRAQIKPVYRDTDFKPRLMLPLSLSYDHRVIDGAEAARFTTFLTKVLEDARRLLL